MRIHEQDLTMLEVTPENASALIWTQPNKEFKYQGEMYDVVKVKCDRQKTYYYCLGDQKEKLLIANFNIAHNTHKDLEKKLKRATVLSFYLPPTSITKIQYPIHILFAEPIGHYISNMVEIHSPPPKSA